MPRLTRLASSAIKTALTLWGVVSTVLGAARGVGIDLHAPDADWAGAFVVLSYYSVLAIGIFGFASSRVASKLLGLSAVLALAILVLTQPLANGLGLGLSFQSALGIILRGPALASFLLLVISRSERMQETNERA